jgi:hypothetical protein
MDVFRLHGRVRLIPDRPRSVAALLALLCIGRVPIAAAQPAAEPPAQTATSPGEETAGPGASATSATETATARALFREGVELADAQRWTEAADRFDRVLAIRWSSAAAYNLAGALTELGRLVEACEGYRAVIRDAGTPAEMRAEARRALARLEPKLGTLRIDVTGDRTGVQVHVDGLPLPPAAWGVSVPADPGPHVIVATRDGRAIDRAEVMLGEGGPLHDGVVLQAPPAAPSPAAVAAAYDADGRGRGRAGQATATGNQRPVTETWWFWTGAGVLATTAVAIVLIAAVGGEDDGPGSPVAGNLEPGVLTGRVEGVP